MIKLLLDTVILMQPVIKPTEYVQAGLGSKLRVKILYLLASTELLVSKYWVQEEAPLLKYTFTKT